MSTAAAVTTRALELIKQGRSPDEAIARAISERSVSPAVANLVKITVAAALTRGLQA